LKGFDAEQKMRVGKRGKLFQPLYEAERILVIMSIAPAFLAKLREL
jgi:hypothetical protein